MLDWLKKLFTGKPNSGREMTPYEIGSAISRIFALKEDNTTRKVLICKHCGKENKVAEEDITVHIQPMFEEFVEHCKAVMTTTGRNLVTAYEEKVGNNLREIRNLTEKLEYLVNCVKVARWDVAYYKKVLEKAKKSKSKR